ncbi:MAG: HDIG domain-containing protein [Bacteroides sp.]|nr:HDIG domain-containing protein [Bacteroides sp.]
MWKQVFSKLNLIRAGLWLAAVVILVLILPRPDHQSYSYELNQPWKYPLLTADFDVPVRRDSTTAKAMLDSINRRFVPFVTRDTKAADANITRFENAESHHGSGLNVGLIVSLLSHVYQRGIVDASVYDAIQRNPAKSLRISDDNEQENVVNTIDASEMLSPKKAFEYIDSVYNSHSDNANTHLNEATAKALYLCINPNVVIDSVADNKYRSQAYLNVTGAIGTIKKGQRIVDRGEIVDAQIFTNLNTYMEMLESQQSQNSDNYNYIFGQILYIALVMAMLYFFLYFYRSSFFNNIRQMIFLICFIVIYVIFAVVMFEYVPGGLYLVPFAAVPVVILIFFDARTAIFALMTTVFISVLVATYQFTFIFLELTAGICATFSIKQLSRRSQLLRTALVSFVVYSIGYIAITLFTEGKMLDMNWHVIGTFAINSVILSFTYILIVVLEKIFGFTSTVTLVELSDINNPILRRLAEEAPGTFQHSMQVSTLASEAARAIGANTQLVRTGALYHDIGKMESPIFFTENQHGVNPHAGLNPETSAQKIISHVTGGLQMASKAKLPAVIKDFIAQHHGRSLTRYFYNTAVNENPDKYIDPAKFQYPGPNPQSRETAILMMADCVEAASRSLPDYSAATINSLVDRIIDGQAAEGLFKESPISYRDVEIVKETFKKRLATIYHSRVAYPTIHKKEGEEKK